MLDEVHVKPLLFLDVDGVLNSAEWMRSVARREEREQCGASRESSLDPTLCKRLGVLRATGAELVLSSAWRKLRQPRNRYGIQRPAWFEKILHRRGCRSARFIGQTPSLWTHRGLEIQRWLDENPGHDRFAIVDDDSDMEHLAPRLVQTSWEVGLTEEKCGELVAMLTERA